VGYVGLPLAVEFARAGFTAVGVDLDARKVDTINRGESYIPDVPTSDVHAVHEGRAAVGERRSVRDPHARHDQYLRADAAAKDKGSGPVVRDRGGRDGGAAPAARSTIVLESTTYPGTTDEVVRPVLERGGLVAGRDFFLAFSPERVDPGNTKFTTRNVPKVVGGTRRRAHAWRKRSTVRRSSA
jgi:UDP-N-acetyl-D-mannosaminuronate dehydrogenase